MHLSDSMHWFYSLYLSVSQLCTFVGCFVPSDQVISVFVSTFTVFTTCLVAAAAWAYVVFTELNMSICFLANGFVVCHLAFARVDVVFMMRF